MHDAAGTAAERTALAWSRTSLAVLTNGGLLLLRHVTGAGAVQWASVGAALAIAVLVLIFGRVRAQQVRNGGTQPPGPSAAMVVTLGFAVAVFGVFVTAGLLVF
jgi:uncharacterized membrane protein YidH (DUF202 family)